MDCAPVCPHLCCPGKTKAFMTSFLYVLILSDVVSVHSAAFCQGFTGTGMSCTQNKHKEIIFDTSGPFTNLGEKK